ncbi:MAG: hypothetical protein D6822_00125 [Cyanobacteria bacterium J149]|nr:MAG: hypothetical protein D6822_00125 [Cyanobacteria bacterium J149]
MSKRNAKGQFKRGVSGNPSGRPKKGYSITEWFRSMMKAKPEVRDAIGKKIIEKALKGDITAMKLIWNYMDGLPKQSHEISGPDGGPIPILGAKSVSNNDGNKETA